MHQAASRRKSSAPSQGVPSPQSEPQPLTGSRHGLPLLPEGEEGGAAVTWDVGLAPPCGCLPPPPSTAAPLVAAPSFPSLTLGSPLSLSTTFPTPKPRVSFKNRPYCSKSSSHLPSPPGESPHFFFSSLLPPFYSKIRTEIRLFLTLIPL